MVERRGKTGIFFGCSRYPQCKRTSPVLLDLECPRCTAPLVVRFAKKSGKRFTGCSAYPACDYVAWRTPHVCPSCGGPCLGSGDEEAPDSRQRPVTVSTSTPQAPDVDDDEAPF